MRILQVIPDFKLGGIQKGGAVIATGLARKNLDVTVVGFDTGPRLKQLIDIGIDAKCIDRSEFIQFVKELVPDIIHVHTAYADNKLISDLEAFKGLVVYTPVFGRPSNAYKHTRHFKICCVGEFTAWRYWRWLGKPTSGIYSVPITPFLPPLRGQSTLSIAQVTQERERFKLPRNAFVVGRLARNDILKWHPKTAKLVIDLLATNDDIYWISIGMPKIFSDAITASRFASRFKNLEPISDFEVVASILQIIDVHVFASRAGECFSASIAEGMGIGVPCVALTHPLGDSGEIEQIEPYITGLLAANLAGVIAGVTCLHNNRSLLSILKKNSQQHVQNFWDVNVVTDQLVIAYSAWLSGADAQEDAYLLHEHYEELHFKRLKAVLGINSLFSMKCQILRSIYLNYQFFKIGRYLKNIFT